MRVEEIDRIYGRCVKSYVAILRRYYCEVVRHSGKPEAYEEEYPGRKVAASLLNEYFTVIRVALSGPLKGFFLPRSDESGILIVCEVFTVEKTSSLTSLSMVVTAAKTSSNSATHVYSESVMLNSLIS